MNSAKLVKGPDSVRRGISGLAGTDATVKAPTYIAQPVDPSESGLNAGMQGKQNTAVRPVVVKQTDYKNLKTGQDFRYQSKDSADQSLGKISNDPGPRSTTQPGRGEV